MLLKMNVRYPTIVQQLPSCLVFRLIYFTRPVLASCQCRTTLREATRLSSRRPVVHGSVRCAPDQILGNAVPKHSVFVLITVGRLDYVPRESKIDVVTPEADETFAYSPCIFIIGLPSAACRPRLHSRDGLRRNQLWSVTRTPNELSIVCSDRPCRRTFRLIGGGCLSRLWARFHSR